MESRVELRQKDFEERYGLTRETMQTAWDLYMQARRQYEKFGKQKKCNVFETKKTFGRLFFNKFCRKGTAKYGAEFVLLDLVKSRKFTICSNP